MPYDYSSVINTGAGIFAAGATAYGTWFAVRKSKGGKESVEELIEEKRKIHLIADPDLRDHELAKFVIKCFRAKQSGIGLQACSEIQNDALRGRTQKDSGFLA